MWPGDEVAAAAEGDSGQSPTIPAVMDRHSMPEQGDSSEEFWDIPDAIVQELRSVPLHLEFCSTIFRLHDAMVRSPHRWYIAYLDQRLTGHVDAMSPREFKFS